MILLILIVLAGMFDAIRDKIVFDFEESVFDYIKSYWIESPFITAVNKYTLPEYMIVWAAWIRKILIFSQSTFLVAITDLFHNVKFWNQVLMFVAIFMNKEDLIFGHTWKSYVFYYLLENFSFTIFYNYIFDKMNFKQLIPTMAKSIGLVWGVGLILIGIAIAITPEYYELNFEWDASKPGFWLLVISFSFVALFSLAWIINKFRKKK